ncbi:MAG TPA: hypothetical protein VF775_00545 [Geobacteraceae bacterium]
MTVHVWENWGMKFYWVVVLVVVFVFGVVAYLAEKKPDKMRRPRGKKPKKPPQAGEHAGGARKD